MSDSKMRNAISAQQQARPQVTVQEFGAKFQTKNSIYQFLTVDLGAYLPPKTSVTIYFMRDLILKKKKYVKADNVKMLSAPNYEGLTINDFLSRANGNSVIRQFLPDEHDIPRLPRSFVINLMYTVVGEEVRNFVRHVVEERNLAVRNNQRMALELDDEIRDAFEKSTSVAQYRGNAFHCLKPGSKRRRTQAEVAAARDAQELQRQVSQEQESQIQQLQMQLKQVQDDYRSSYSAQQILEGMIASGDAVQLESGEVKVVPRDSHGANEIVNLDAI